VRFTPRAASRARDEGGIMKSSFGSFVRLSVARYLGVPERSVDAAHRLREDLGLLPLDLVLVVISLEDVASSRFPVERLDSVHTVEELTRMLWSCRFPGVALQR